MVLKPITSAPIAKRKAVTQCAQDSQALGDLRLVAKRPPTKGDDDESPRKWPHIMVPKISCANSEPFAQRTIHRRRTNRNGHWSRLEKRWKSTTWWPAPCSSPSKSLAAEAEVDEVEGHIFISFATREALESHVRAEPTFKTSLVSPDSSSMTPTQPMKTGGTIPETTEEKIGRLETILLQDLKVAKHRQVIHPVLQEVGLKLSSLDPSKPIDLHYLGVRLPLSPFNPPTKDHDSEGLAFISRTGKTSDVTKIKGWKNKFGQSKQPNDGSQKNMSAFCSNMLDEYLESEAQRISERAAAFSAGPEGPVAYQLPAKSASYVKTLDSALKHRKIAADISNKPCPHSYKPLLYAALTSPPPDLTRTATTSTSTDSTPHGAAQMTAIKSPPPPNAQIKLLGMEDDVVNQGCSRTLLTSARVLASLAAMLTDKMEHQGAEKSPPYPTRKLAGPECRQDFCRLGCVCSSLINPNEGLPHCRQPACMFGCVCSMQTTQDGPQGDDASSGGSNPEHAPCTASQSNKLWNRKICDVDPDPLFQPKNLCAPHVKPFKRNKAPLVQQIQEEDKDPVYKYLESFLTCARVRPFISMPPSQNTTDYTPTMGTKRKARVQHAGKPKSHGTAASQEKPIKTQIEIQSACRWEKDREMVLGTLCSRLNQDKLSKPYNTGPYLVYPIAKIFLQKPSGSILTYRVRISRPEMVCGVLEDQSANKKEPDSTDEEPDSVEGDPERPMQRSGVKPFLAGVLPAGFMVARTKADSDQSGEPIQVNGKTYKHVNLLLGSMGSLHPANRLAAYATGRLQPRANIARRVDHNASAAGQKVDPKPANQDLDIKSANQNFVAYSRLLPLVMSAKNSTDVRTHPLFNLLKQKCTNQEPEGPTPRPPAPHTTVNLFPRSARSPLSLTVSPSPKTPSFLSQSGTYSFRICPASNQGEKVKNCLGIALPGGFTLLPLPQPEPPKEPTSEVAEEEVSNGNVPAAGNETPVMKDVHLSCSSEDCESSLSDDSADHNSEVDSSVDIETVEDSKQELTIARLKKLAQSKSFSLGDPDNSKAKRRNHSYTEKQRRSEQRALFDELQYVLGQSGGSKLNLLRMALKEIHTLKSISDILMERKKKLMQIQALHVKKLSALSGKPSELIRHNLKIILSSLKHEGDAKAEPFLTSPDQSKRELAQLPAPPPSPKSPPPDVPKHHPEAPSLPPPASPNHVPRNKSPPTSKPNHVLPPVTPVPSPQFAIPLIRSKTGRLILPSSMKPAAQGIYRLMLMNPNKDADVPPPSSNADSAVPLDEASPPNAAEAVDKDCPLQIAAPEKKVTPRSNSSPSSAHRPRGRPPKKQRFRKSPEIAGRDSPFLPKSNPKFQPKKRGRGRPRKAEPFADPEVAVGVGASRPRTRGSLGKDFPSAKRQSWIDLEMELEPDVESE